MSPRGIRVIGPRGEGSRKIVAPSKDDMRAVIEAASEELRLMLLFAASTGARAGEQWAARWRDVNFDKVEFQISRRVDVYGDEGAKRSAGVRTVPLSGQLVGMLKAWKLKSKFSKPDDLIFPNREGGYVGHDNLVKRRFLPLFDALAAKHRKTRSAMLWPLPLLIGTGSATSRFRVGLRRGLPRRLCRLSQAMRRYRSRWTVMGICSQAMIIGKRWIRLPRDYSSNVGLSPHTRM